MHLLVGLVVIAINISVLLGNFVVLYALVSQRSLRSPTNRLVLSLTVADFLLGLFIIPLSLIQDSTGSWFAGDLLCRLWLALDVWLSTASIHHLFAISVDRFMAVHRPLHYPSITSKKMITRMTFLCWCPSFILAATLFVLEESQQDRKTCTPMILPDVFIIVSGFFSFVIPTLAMASLNIITCRTVVKIGRRTELTGAYASEPMRIHRGPTPKTSLAGITAEQRSSSPENRRKYSDLKEATPLVRRKNGTCETTNSRLPLIAEFSGTSSDSTPVFQRKYGIAGPDFLPTRFYSFFEHILLLSFIFLRRRGINQHIPMERKRIRTEVRIARTTTVVVAACVVCWCPFTTIYLLQAYDLCTVGDCMSEELFTWAFWLGYSNSALNPLLYALFSRDFRLAIRRLLRRPFRSRIF